MGTPLACHVNWPDLRTAVPDLNWQPLAALVSEVPTCVEPLCGTQRMVLHLLWELGIGARIGKFFLTCTCSGCIACRCLCRQGAFAPMSCPISRSWAGQEAALVGQ